MGIEELITGLKQLSAEQQHEAVNELYRHLERKPRHRGGKAKTAGITNDHVAVIVTCDRADSQAMQVSGGGRIGRKDVEKAFSGKICNDIVFCTDAHRSYQ